MILYTCMHNIYHLTCSFVYCCHITHLHYVTHLQSELDAEIPHHEIFLLFSPDLMKYSASIPPMPQSASGSAER